MADQVSPEEVQFYAADSSPYGLTYGQWTVEWWRWLLSIPMSVSPALDKSGKYASLNQPPKDVWFLAGKVGSEESQLPKRDCRVPPYRSILFPVINCEVNSLECPQLTTLRDLMEYVDKDEDSIASKECFVNDISIPVQRIKSDPMVFEVEINRDNPYGVKNGGVTFAAADGYWVFLKPLPMGKHEIVFNGSCKNGKLYSGAEYNILIS